MKQQETFQNIRQHRPRININQFVALTRLKPHETIIMILLIKDQWGKGVKCHHK